MLIKGPSTFHDSMKPIIYFNWLLGLGAYRLPGISDTAYFLMQAYRVIFTLINWIITYMGLAGITDNTYARYIANAPRKISLVLIYMNTCIAVISPLLKWLRNKELKDCLRQMPIMEQTFQDIFGTRTDYKKQYIQLCYRVIVTVFVTSISCISDSGWILRGDGSLWIKFAIGVTMHYPIMVGLVLDLNFCTFVGYVQKKFRILNDSLLGLTEKSSTSYHGGKILVISRRVIKVTPGSRMQDMRTDKHHLVQEIRRMHLELCKLVEKMNLAFGIHNLLSMGYAFALVTGLLYNVYGAVMQMPNFTFDSFVEIGSPIVWTLIYIFKIWIVNHSCWSACNEAERTGEVIYELLGTKDDEQLQKEIQEFGVQMLQNPVRFNACGFFILDYTLVQSVIGSITTYLVILIQMLNVTSSPISNKLSAWNVTKVPEN